MRRFVFFLLTVIFLASAAFAVSGFVLDAVSRKTISYVERHAGEAGLKLNNISYRETRLRGLDSVTWKGLSADVRIPARRSGKTEERASLLAGEMTLRLENLAAKQFSIEVRDIGMIFLPAASLKEQKRREELTRLEGDFVYRFTLGLAPSGKPAEEIKAHVEKLVRFIRKGSAEADISFSGTIFVQVKGKPAEVKISSSREDGISRIKADKDDLKKISRRMREQLTEAEVELLSANPVRAPLLLSITEQAVKKAEAAEKKDPSISENAYKHVLWSYFLTRAFGAEFAKAVTDAHEKGDPDDTTADHAMDYKNNEMGRRYAQAGYEEASLLERVKTDPEIILKS